MPVHRSVERITIGFIPPAIDALDAVCNRTFASRADAVNRAVQLYDRLQNIQELGGKILIQEPDSDDVVEVQFW